MKKEQQITILFFPQRPSKHTTIFKIAKILNYNVTNSLREKYDLVINWEDTTFRNNYQNLNNIGSKVVNLQCVDISKRKIDQVFSAVFKYSTLVDPTTLEGKCVKKNNLNAAHDGYIFKCPIEKPEHDYIYQRLINNENEEWGIYDIRTPIFNQTIPFVLIKFKTKTKRFKDHYTNALVKNTNEVFSQKEVDLICKFCKKIGLDYGELDILRDNRDNKIYIIDANNTPWWSTSLPRTEVDHAIRRLADTFSVEFMAN